MKRFVSTVLLLALLLTWIPAPQALAAEPEIISEVHINPMYEGLLDPAVLLPPDIPAPAGDSGQFFSDIDSAAAYVRSQMMARVPVYTVLMPRDLYYADLMNDIFYKACEHTGDPKGGDSLYRQWGGSKYNAAWDGDNVAMTYSMTYYTTAEQEAELDTSVAALLGQLNCDPTDRYGTVKKVYDWICANITYDYDNLGNSSYKRMYTAYAALIDRTAVCQGYALLFYRLMLELGIDCRTIVGYGNGGLHAWNIVEIGGKYYDVDSTWDAGSASYSYFLRIDSTFGDHTRNEEFDTPEFHAAYPMGDADFDPTRDPCASGHSWTGGSCTEPQKCSVCSLSAASAPGHTWSEATCTAPKTCTVCGAEEGTYVHSYDNDEDKSCNVCGQFRLLGCVNEAKGVQISSRNNYLFEISGSEDVSVRFLRQEEATDDYGILYYFIYELIFPEAGNYTLRFIQEETKADLVFSALITEHTFENGICTKCDASDGTAHTHSWMDATCTAPKTCSECGATEGDALGHSWMDATCTEPKTCSECGATEGDALGHSWDSEACTAEKLCTVCSEPGEPGSHTYDDELDEDCNTCGQYRLLGCAGEVIVVTITTWQDDSFTLSGDGVENIQVRLLSLETDTMDGETVYYQDYELIFGETGTFELVFTQRGTGSPLPFTAEITAHSYQDGLCVKCGTEQSGDVLMGDADADGEVTYLDAMTVLRSSVGLTQLTGDAGTAADVDRDGVVTYLDAMMILRYSVGLIAQFPSAPLSPLPAARQFSVE